MHFELYTTKNIKQCMSALNERLAAAKDRPGKNPLAGSTTKEGQFWLTLEGKVGGFTRRTQLRGTIEKTATYFTIRGYVPDGVPPLKMRLGVLALVIVGMVILMNGNVLLGLFTSIIGGLIYVPLVGDYHHSALLLKDLKRTLDAKDKPPA
jgi:hypothetical protein